MALFEVSPPSPSTSPQWRLGANSDTDPTSSLLAHPYEQPQVLRTGNEYKSDYTGDGPLDGADNCQLLGACACGWGCCDPPANSPARASDCRLLGLCTCGWGCLSPRDEQYKVITWSQAFKSQWLADRRIIAATQYREWRMEDLAHTAGNLNLIVLSFRSTGQLYNWIRWLTDQQRAAMYSVPKKKVPECYGIPV